MQVFAGCVLERHEICNRFASDERGQKTFSTIVTTVAAFLGLVPVYELTCLY